MPKSFDSKTDIPPAATARTAAETGIPIPTPKHHRHPSFFKHPTPEELAEWAKEDAEADAKALRAATPDAALRMVTSERERIGAPTGQKQVPDVVKPHGSFFKPGFEPPTVSANPPQSTIAGTSAKTGTPIPTAKHHYHPSFFKHPTPEELAEWAKEDAEADAKSLRAATPDAAAGRSNHAALRMVTSERERIGAPTGQKQVPEVVKPHGSFFKPGFEPPAVSANPPQTTIAGTSAKTGIPIPTPKHHYHPSFFKHPPPDLLAEWAKEDAEADAKALKAATPKRGASRASRAALKVEASRNPAVGGPTDQKHAPSAGAAHGTFFKTPQDKQAGAASKTPVKPRRLIFGQP